MTSTPDTAASKPAGFFSRLGMRWSKRPALVCLELFVALALTVNFFHFVRSQCLPKKDGNTFSATTFAYLSGNVVLSREKILESWQARLLAPTLSSWWLDRQLTEPVNFNARKYRTFQELYQSTEFQKIFGLYHSAWLFFLFAALICLRRDALLIMLGVFGGLMYNLIEPAGQYYYPWDMPALFFFTLACLLFDRGKIGLALPVIVLGALFKETVLCCSLLILLGGHWDWKKRVIGFLVVAGLTLGLNRLLLIHHGVPPPMSALSFSHLPSDLSGNPYLFQNIRGLFTAGWNHVLFANAGALFLMMLIPWRNRRDMVFKLLIVVFAVGQFYRGVINEFRVWYELLPLGWILISETVAQRWLPLPVSAEPATSAMDTRFLNRSYGLAMGSLLVIAVGVFGLAQFNSPSPAKGSHDQSLRELVTAAETGDAIAQYKLAVSYENRQDYNAAEPWLQRAAEQGLVDAQYNLGVILINIRRDPDGAAKWFRLASDQGHPAAMYSLGVIYWSEQKYEAGFPLFHESARKGDMYAQWMLGTIYLTANDRDLVEACKWLKLAQLQGLNVARLDLKKCTDLMAADQIADAEQRVKEFRNPGR